MPQKFHFLLSLFVWLWGCSFAILYWMNPLSSAHLGHDSLFSDSAHQCLTETVFKHAGIVTVKNFENFCPEGTDRCFCGFSSKLQTSITCLYSHHLLNWITILCADGNSSLFLLMFNLFKLPSTWHSIVICPSQHSHQFSPLMNFATFLCQTILIILNRLSWQALGSNTV